MKKTRIKIAFLVGGTVMVTLLILLAVFNVGIRRQMEREAITAIGQALDYYEGYAAGEPLYGGYDGEERESLYAVEEIYIARPEEWDESYEMYYSWKQLQIMEWCAENDAGEARRAKIGSGVYFLQEAEYYEEGVGAERLIVYVDATGEYDAVHRINIVFFLAAVWIGIFGSIIGYALGKRLEENESAQKQFFENTSHELKTPLTAIKGYAEGIEKGIITDYKKTGRVIAAQADHMSRLVEEILCMAKIESGAMPIHKEAVSMDEFIQDCLMPFEGAVINRGLHVELSIEDQQVQIDSDQFGHAVSNLISNAIKYAGGRIAISFQNDTLSIWNDTEEIGEEDLKHIFDRFYTGKNGNTGIGLALAKDIIQLHGFFVSVEKEKGGICFLVRCKES